MIGKKRPTRWSPPVVFGPSKTIPGQALRPAELLKRHLAGTLPPIDLRDRYEFHYDENGEQIGEPMPLEIHEIHRITEKLREAQKAAATEARKKQAEKFKNQIIDEYLREQKELEAKKGSDGTPKEPGAGSTPAPVL